MSTKDWIQSHSGKRVDLVRPDPETIDILDIAHALSQLCRYTGHTARHYSVAEHSIRVSDRAFALTPAEGPRKDVARWGLLHDATEAYLGDVSRPLKHLPGMEGYRKLEAKWMKAIAKRFNLKGSQPEEVSRADQEMLGTEAYHLMQPVHPEWGATCPGGVLPEPLPYAGHIGWDAETAKTRFLMRFYHLFPEFRR